MPASKLPELYVVCEPAATRDVRRALGDSVVAELRRRGVVFLQVHDEPRALNVTRLMDRFFIVAAADERQEALIQSFFDAVAPDYPELIDRERNVDNIETLLALLARRCDHGALIDFGCGTGLALPICASRGYSVIGIETASEMRRLARRAGMYVVTGDDVGKLAKYEIAGAFASYVLHLVPRPHELPDLFELLRGRGPLVANFHKGRGVEAFAQCATELGAYVEPISAPAAAERHGPYLAAYVD